MGLLGRSHGRPSALDGDGRPGPSSLLRQCAPGSHPSRLDGALSPVTPPRHTRSPWRCPFALAPVLLLWLFRFCDLSFKGPKSVHFLPAEGLRI